MSTLDPAELATEILRKARLDLTNAQGKITDAIRAIETLEQPDTSARCPNCGVKTRGPLSLAEHVHTSHSGPLPEHWAKAERLAGEPKLPPIMERDATEFTKLYNETLRLLDRSSVFVRACPYPEGDPE